MPFSIANEWLAQAERDLTVAEHLLTQSFYEWACYAAQQSGEKAIKAVRLCLGTEVKEIKEHDLDYLLGKIPWLHPTKPDSVLGRVSVLSRHNQAARYPEHRGKAGAAPCKTYDEKAALEAVDVARELNKFCMALCKDIESFWRAR